MPAEATQAEEAAHERAAAAIVAATRREAASQQSSGSPQPRVEPVMRRALADFLPQPAEVAIPDAPTDRSLALTRPQIVLALGDRGADDSRLAAAPELSSTSQPARRQHTPAEVDSRASPASAASQASSGAEGDQPARIVTNAPPIYPPEALAARLTGRVVLRVTVGIDGRAVRAAVHRSSGIASLDAAALAAVRSWRFAPARRGGVAVERDIAVPVRFTLAE
jgi:protein TonB